MSPAATITGTAVPLGTDIPAAVRAIVAEHYCVEPDEVADDATDLLAIPGADSLDALTGAGLRAVLAERVEQIDRHGFTIAHDLGHHPGDFVAAAVSYANTGHDQLHGKDHPRDEVDPTWPWEGEAWRPGTPRDNLVKAAALLLAAIDRIDHAPCDSGEDPPITARDLPY